MYSEIKKNIIDNFLNKNYLYTCGCSKPHIVQHIIDYSIFKTSYDFDNDILTMYLGDNVNITFNFIWESYNKQNITTLFYKLINIK